MGNQDLLCFDGVLEARAADGGALLKVLPLVHQVPDARADLLAGLVAAVDQVLSLAADRLTPRPATLHLSLQSLSQTTDDKASTEVFK